MLKQTVKMAKSASKKIESANQSSQHLINNVSIEILAVSNKQFYQKKFSLGIDFGFYSTHFGRCLIGITSGRICWTSFVDEPDEFAIRALQSEWPGANLSLKPSIAREIAKSFIPVHQGHKKRRLPLIVHGTGFQIEVWNALLSISPGQRVTYKAIAKELGRPNASRAVGNAIGRNPISYFIPCHRVIRNSGAIGGYRWSAERKHSILAWESDNLN